jgi:predicted ATPase
MARIEGIRIHNFRALRDVTLGRVWSQQQPEPLTPMTAVIGKNGSGKSTLFDAFGFLADCLRTGVEEAFDARGRGGFGRVKSQGSEGPIEFEVYYKEEGNARPITYELSIDRDASGRPYVVRERLRQRRKGQKHGWPFSFLILNEGKGVAWRGETEGQQIEEGELDLLHLMETVKHTQDKEESRETEVVELDDKRKLGIATLGSLKQHPRVSAFRRFIEGWYLSYFNPDAARSLPLAGPQKHLRNLGEISGRRLPWRGEGPFAERLASRGCGKSPVGRRHISPDRHWEQQVAQLLFFSGRNSVAIEYPRLFSQLKMIRQLVRMRACC